MTPPRILILTGNGKGKTTSAFGMALRTLGHGGRVCVIQFIKHDGGYGETRALRLIPGAEVHCTGLGFTPRQPDSPLREKHAEAARAGWELARARLTAPEPQMVILDEVFYPLNYGFLEEAPLLEALSRLPEGKIVILTGRNAPEALMERADTVSHIECVKHALSSGIKSQQNVEW